MLTVIGAAVVAFSLAGAGVSGDTAYLATRNQEPSRLEVVDLAGDALVDSAPLGEGDGAWAVTPSADGVVVGTFGAPGLPNVLRYAAGAVATLGAVGSTYTWDVDAGTAGEVSGVLGVPGGSFEVAPGADAITPTDLIAPAETGRATAVVGGLAVAGGRLGDTALLVVEDPTAPDGRRSILPSSLAGDEIVYDVEPAGDDRVVVGTIGADRGDPAVALIDPADPEGAFTTRIPGEDVVDQVVVDRGAVYATARPSGALYRIAPGRGRTPVRIAVPRQGSETRSLDVRGGRLLGTSAEGTVWEVDPQTGAVDLRTPEDLGLTADAQLAQSIAVGGGVVYGAGSFALMTRDLATGATRTSFVPGEAKAMEVVDGTAYLAIYPVGEVWAVDGAAGEPRRVAELPDDQLRPQDLAVLPDGRLAVTTTDDFGGGAIHLVDPTDGAVTSVVDPLGPGRIPTGLAVDGDDLLVGSTSTPAVVARLDGATLAEEWVAEDALPGGGFAVGVAVTADGRVVATTSRGEIAVLDAATGAVTATSALDGVVLGEATAGPDGVVVAGYDATYRIDPATATPTAIATGLAAEVFGYPHLAADEGGAVYTIAGRDVVQVDPTATAAPTAGPQAARPEGQADRPGGPLPY